MTNEQINAVIAAVYGWEADYCGCLNAMHEAECIFDPPSEHWQYYVILDDLCGSSFKAIRATARQRAEAFLRTLGKWATTEESSVVGEEVQP